MEIFSVFSSDNKLIEQLIEVFFNDKNLCFITKGEDTIYLDGIDSDRFYLHFDNDFDKEMEINFEKKEEEFIKFFLKGDNVFMLDISYNNRTLLYRILFDFTKVIKSSNSESENANLLLFHDPFDRFVEINGMGRVLE